MTSLKLAVQASRELKDTAVYTIHYYGQHSFLPQQNWRAHGTDNWSSGSVASCVSKRDGWMDWLQTLWFPWRDLNFCPRTRFMWRVERRKAGNFWCTVHEWVFRMQSHHPQSLPTFIQGPSPHFSSAWRARSGRRRCWIDCMQMLKMYASPFPSPCSDGLITFWCMKTQLIIWWKMIYVSIYFFLLFDLICSEL